MSNIPHDKLLHFFWGSLISFPLIYIFDIYGFILSLIIFAAKEIIYDKCMGKGNPEVLDFIFSSIPAVLYIIIKDTQWIELVNI